MRNIGVFLRGLAMGFCDIIPGVSGGTIAFISGIYERLMNGVKQYTPQNLVRIYDFEIRKKLDILFFVLLGLGVLLGVVLASLLIPPLLESYPVYVLSFFIGLILASALGITLHVEKKFHFSHGIYFLLGLVLGGGIVVLVPLDMPTNLISLFFSGFLAVCALFLPGISGAYILLLLGKYEFMLNVLHTPLENIWYLVVFLLGMVCGALTFSRVISYALKKWREGTIYLLSGLIIGSLILPVQTIVETPFYWGGIGIIGVILLFFLGMGIILVMSRKK